MSPADLHQPDRRIEVGKKIVLFVDRPADVISQSGIDRQSRSDAPVILDETSERLLRHDAPAVSYKHETAAPNISGSEAFQIAEADLAGAKRIPQIVGAAGAEFSAELQIVLSPT